MNQLKEAARSALNALNDAVAYTRSPAWSPSMTDEVISASKALTVALALPDSEPVAWINKQGDYVELSTKSTVYGSHTIPLYPPPQPAIAPEPQEPALDRAAERGEYIAKAAENLLRATENLALADIRYAETGDDHGIEDAENAVSEFSRSLISKIYEFRKRVEQPATAPAPQEPVRLTDDEIDAAYYEIWSTVAHAHRIAKFARAIESAINAKRSQP